MLKPIISSECTAQKQPQLWAVWLLPQEGKKSRQSSGFWILSNAMLFLRVFFFHEVTYLDLKATPGDAIFNRQKRQYCEREENFSIISSEL